MSRGLPGCELNRRAVRPVSTRSGRGRWRAVACPLAISAGSERKEQFMRFKRGFALAVAGTAAIGGAGLMAATPAMASGHGGKSFIGRFSHNDTIVSTVPHNGDVNPYGIVVVNQSQGSLVRGDILISN